MKATIAVVALASAVQAATVPRAVDPAALTALPAQFVKGVQGCWTNSKYDDQLAFNQCMTTSSLKTLQAISSGPGADLPIADDLNAVLKAANTASSACVKSSKTAAALDTCLQGALTKAGGAAANDTQKQLIKLLGMYADGVYACSEGAPSTRAACVSKAIKAVFNSLVPILVG